MGRPRFPYPPLVHGPLACLRVLAAKNVACGALAARPVPAAPKRVPKLVRLLWVCFPEEPRAVTTAAAPFRVPADSGWGSVFSPLLPTPSPVFLTVAVLVGVRWGLAVGVTCVPLMASYVGNLPVCLLPHFTLPPSCLQRPCHQIRFVLRCWGHECDGGEFCPHQPYLSRTA